MCHVPRKRRGIYRILVGKLEGKRPLGRPRSRLVGVCVVDFTILHFVPPDSEGYDLIIIIFIFMSFI